MSAIPGLPVISPSPGKTTPVLSGRPPSGSNPALVYLASLKPSGRVVMAGSLDIVARRLGAKDARSMPWASLRYEHLVALRQWLAETFKPATANRYLAAIKGTLREAWRLGQFPSEELERVRDIKSVSGSSVPAGRGLSSGELRALLMACVDGSPSGYRDAAVLALGYGAGLRRAEIAALDIEDAKIDGETIVVKVRHAKGGRERVVYLDNGARDALRDYMEIRGKEPGGLFWQARKGGKLVHQGMTDDAVWRLIEKRAKLAGVTDVSPHDLRRSFVSDLLDAGVDVTTVSKMAGHASVLTTAKYDRRGEEAKRKAAKALHVPYPGRPRDLFTEQN